MTYSLHDLDTEMLEYLGYKNGFFIEDGANDVSITNDPTLTCQSQTWVLLKK